MNGQYYVEYHGVFGMMGTPVMSEATWTKLIGWLSKNVKELADMSCEQVCHLNRCTRKLSHMVRNLVGWQFGYLSISGDGSTVS